MTNPPWSGALAGRITDTSILHTFQLGHRWEWNADGEYVPTSDLMSGIPPEYLFVEQCTNWLAPGGTLAIVLPKGILDNLEPALAVRHFMFRHYQVQAVIICHKDTFQPYTGSHGCLIVAKKKTHPSDARHYKIFMAINRKIGQDSEGVPVYKKDERGKPTQKLDQDLDFIYEAWQSFLKGRLKESEYTFSIEAKSLDAKMLKLNPQFFLPELNKSLQRIMSLDGNGFTVARLGDNIASQIWKGSWWKRDDLTVELPNENTVEYLTPSTILMGRVGTKYLDLSRCSLKRKTEILRHKAREGEILITRSGSRGSLGRVTIVGRTLLGKILSDDLIRVWIDDLGMRALVFAFLRSPAGQDQLLRNEYGTVQQHLEPPHVADLQLPLPDDKIQMDQIIEAVTMSLEAHERSIEMEERADGQLLKLLQWSEDKPVSIEQRFRSYADIWRRETRHKSSLTKMMSHAAYTSIIDMGTAVVPLLLEELRDRPDHWLVALNKITNEDPAVSGSTFKEAVAAWLEWGREREYLP
jgi:type I restriction-modification system DNA methylase subunit